MKLAPFILAASLLLFGCPKQIQPKYPVIETKPPEFIWVCSTNAEGTIVCYAVPEMNDVPPKHECVYQQNGSTVCWL